jgi:hypothetical protein
MAWLFHRSLALLVVLVVLASPALAQQDEVRVLRSRRALSYLSSNGNGASIYLAHTEIDLAVRSASYAKDVGVRWTTDGWVTSQEAAAHWVGPLADGSERWHVRLDHGTVGKNLRLGNERGDMGPLFVRFAAYLRVAGRTAWDDARGADHAAALLAPAAQPLPQARTAPRTVTIDGALHLVGGQEREGYRFTVPDVLRLDPDTGAWTRVASLPRMPGPSGGSSPEVLAGYEVAATGRTLHVIGGTIIKIGSRVTSIMSLDLDAGTWRAGPDLPGPLHDRKAVVVGGALHLVPTTSLRPAGDSDRAFVLEAGATAWRAQPVTGLGLLAGASYVTAAHDGALYLFGGRLGAGQVLRDALRYDGRTRTITRVATCPADLAGVEPTAVLGGRVLIGNVDVDLGRGTASALLFDPVTSAFTTLPRRGLLPFEATLGAAPAALVAGPGGVNPRRLHAALVFSGTSRVDTWAPDESALAAGESRTVLRVTRDAGWGHRVTLRGGAAPLAWGRGQETRWTPGNVWTFETTDLLEDVLTWKPLVDDRQWYPGPDLQVRKGETLSVTFW